MKEKKNIDRIFQEKLSDFEREPREEVWANISAELDKKRRKRVVLIPLWAKIGGVAAILAIIIAGLMLKTEPDFDSIENPVVEENIPKNNEHKDLVPALTEKEKIADVDNEGLKESSSEENGNKKTQQNSENQKFSRASAAQYANQENANQDPKQSTATNSSKNNKNKNFQNSENEVLIAKNDRITENDDQKSKDAKKVISEKSAKESAIAQVETETANEDKDSSSTQPEAEANVLLAELEKNSEKEPEIPEIDSKRFSVSTFAAPVFYKNLGGNEISSEFDGNATNADVTISYGVKVAYAINKKFKIRTGISKIEVDNTTRDIGFSPLSIAQQFDNISGDSNVFALNNGRTDAAPIQEGITIPNIPENGSASSFAENGFVPGEINQQFGFIEIPVELEYALIDNKFGLNLIGGGSSLFLDKNSLEIVSEDNKSNLGKATNIKNIRFNFVTISN